MRDDDPQTPVTETVSLGGTTGGGRLAALFKRLAPRQQGTLFVGSTMILGVVVLTTVVLTRSDPASSRQAGTSPPDGAAATAPVHGAVPSPETQLDEDRVWVGYHGVMVALPQSWAHTNSGACGTTRSWITAPPPRARIRSAWRTRHDSGRSCCGYDKTSHGPNSSTTASRRAKSMGSRCSAPDPEGRTGIPPIPRVASTDTLVVLRSPDSAHHYPAGREPDPHTRRLGERA